MHGCTSHLASPTTNPNQNMHVRESRLTFHAYSFVPRDLCSTRFRTLLYPLCVAAGLCYGSTFALVLALAADLFGSEHVATNYGLLDLGESAPLAGFDPAKDPGQPVRAFSFPSLFLRVYNLVAVFLGRLTWLVLTSVADRNLARRLTDTRRPSPRASPACCPERPGCWELRVRNRSGEPVLPERHRGGRLRRLRRGSVFRRNVLVHGVFLPCRMCPRVSCVGSARPQPKTPTSRAVRDGGSRHYRAPIEGTEGDAVPSALLLVFYTVRDSPLSGLDKICT